MKKILLLLVILMNVTLIGYSQENFENYRRNSLCVSVINRPGNNSYGIDDKINEAANEYKVSDKFNDHNIGLSGIDIESIQLSQSEIDEFKKKKSGGGFLSKLGDFNNAMAASMGAPQYEYDALTDEELTVLKLQKYLENNRVAPMLLAKWFNVSDTETDNSFYNMNLIQERGAYNATELDLLQAKESIRGLSILKDAGMDLIPNTYVVLIELKMESAAEVLARTGKKVEKALTSGGNSMDKLFSKAKIKSNAGESLSKLGGLLNTSVQNEAKETSGFYITATTYLFKLDWDDNKEEIFISKYYNANPNALYGSNDFKMKYIDSSIKESKFTEKASFENRDAYNMKLVKRAAFDAIDKSIASLQKKYEDFKVKAPLIDVNEKDATAFIGYKEGIDKSSKFEVLEKTYDEKKNRFKYKKVGSLKIDNNKIWDNRYNIEELGTRVGDEEDGIVHSSVNRTYLKGQTKKLAPGMLIRQTN